MDNQDEMEICPYNETHVIHRTRMPFHLQKCAKQYRGPQLIKCPFNAMHLFKTMADIHEHLVSGECFDFKFNYDHSPPDV